LKEYLCDLNQEILTTRNRPRKGGASTINRSETNILLSLADDKKICRSDTGFNSKDAEYDESSSVRSDTEEVFSSLLPSGAKKFQKSLF
jgi:hypothetical protein